MSAPPPDCAGCQRLLAEVQRLAAEVAELRARLDLHSGNSSKPPSSDHPHNPKSRPGKAGKAREAEASGKRKRGGQPGHPGTTRTLLSVEAVQDVVPCVPTACTHCQGALPPDPAADGPAPLREQVWELPPIIWQVLEYQRHARTCPTCGKRTWGQRPEEAPTGCLGVRAQAAVAVLTGGAHIPRRTAETLLEELLGLPLSLGTLARVEATVSAALAAATADIAAAVGAVVN